MSTEPDRDLRLVTVFTTKDTSQPPAKCAHDEIRVVQRVYSRFHHFFPTRYACGHTDAKSFALDAYGEVIELTDETVKKRLHCGDCEKECLAKISARCALCGNIIMPGDGLVLYRFRDGYPSYAQVVDLENKQCVIGCLRMDCADSGMSYCGNWTEQGYRSAFHKTLHPTHLLGDEPPLPPAA